MFKKIISRFFSKKIKETTQTTESSDDLTKEETAFIEKIRILIANNDMETDYQQLIETAPTDNKGKFWYQCAMTLNELPETDELDLRENGRLHVAYNILSEMQKYNPENLSILAQKIITTKYLAHSYSAQENALHGLEGYDKEKEIAHSKTQYFVNELLTMTEKGVELSSNDPWFAYEREDALDSFGYEE